MGRIIKYFLFAVGGLVALLLIAAVTFSLLFDPNDFRDTIAGQVKDATGRELTIEGDLDVSLFPWLAIDMGSTTLGNAAGFGDEPMAKFDRARLSVKLLPLLLRREISIGTAELDALSLNLQVKRDGRTNWQDLSEREDAATGKESDGAGASAIEVASVALTNASIRYDDAQAGERYIISDLNLKTGAVEPGEPVKLSGGFAFKIQPDETAGTVEIDTTVIFDTDASTVRFEKLTADGSATGFTEGDIPMTFSASAPAIVLTTDNSMATVGEVKFSVLDVDVVANVEDFSYAGSLAPVAAIEVEAFSPKSLAKRLDIELPETADPGALGKMIVTAKAAVSERSITLTNLELVLDETTFKGGLTIPRGSKGAYQFDLSGDSMNLDRYMAPADTGDGAASKQAEAPVEIPAEMIRTLNARGTLKLGEATLSGMRFTDATVGVNSANGQLRMNPLSAKLFDGEYQGDIRINASGKVPVLSVNERIQNVSLGALAEAMLERKDITGQINGTFTLEGQGNDMGEIQKTLKGNMSFVLSDGIWHGTDVWYQLRRARALFRQEAAPEPALPPQTRFSEVSATGVVSEGVMRNDDFKAELPFMQLTGRGTVNFPTAMVDYSLSGRVLERPELASQATAEELSDLTRAVIPIKVTGPLTEPSFKIDFASLVRDRVKEEVRDRVLDKLLGGSSKKEDAPPAEGDEAQKDGEQAPEGAAEGAAEEEPDVEEELKNKLKDLLKR